MWTQQWALSGWLNLGKNLDQTHRLLVCIGVIKVELKLLSICVLL